MSSNGSSSRSNSNIVRSSSANPAASDAAKHRRLVGSALQSPAAVVLLRKYHEKGIDIRAYSLPGNEDFPSMGLAAFYGDLDVIKVLHELLGAEAVNAPDKTVGQTPIFGAVQGGQSAAVRVLCELGADVNVQNIKGTTTVYIAAQQGFVEVIRVLVEFGADVNIQNNEGVTPVYFAAQQGFVDVIRVLMLLSTVIWT